MCSSDLVFPNFAPWAGFRPNLTYRFLPWEDDPGQCTMEIMLLMRFDERGGRPDDVAMVHVDAAQRFADTEGISRGFARVFDQDFSNLPEVHRGLYSLRDKQVSFGRYQESRIRHFHQTLDSFLFADEELPA